MNIAFTPVMNIYVIAAFAVLTVSFITYNLVKARQKRSSALRWTMRLGVALLLSLTLLRPSVPTVAELERLGTQIDVIFVVDTTMSMAVEDIDNGVPRLDAAKKAIFSLAEQNTGARYSIITFNSSAKTELPLSYDLGALKSSLDTMVTDSYSSGNSGTSTTQAAETLTRVLETQAEQFPERSRIVYYITDGEDTSEEVYDMTPVASLIDGGAVVGVGTEEGAPVPLIQFNYEVFKLVKDGYIDGSLSKMNPEQIKNIAEQMGVPESFIKSETDKLLPVKVKAVDTVIKQVDKTAPALFEFYWVLSLLIIALLGLDLYSLSKESRIIYVRSRN